MFVKIDFVAKVCAVEGFKANKTDWRKQSLKMGLIHKPSH